MQLDTKTPIKDVLEKRNDAEDVRQYKCPDCDVVSKYKQNIKSHLNTVHRKTSSEIIDKIATINMEDKDSRGRRNGSLNIDDIMQGGVYTLSKLSIDSLSGLIEECNESHYSDGEKRYKCRVCKMLSKYKRHVLTHIKNVHGKLAMVQCFESIFDFWEVIIVQQYN